MSQVTPSIELLRRLPPAARRSALTAMVVDEFRAVLQMDDDESLLLDSSLFLIGFSSLLLTEAQLRLEKLLGTDLQARALLNSCTVGQVIDYLAREALAELFPRPRTPQRPASQPASSVLWDEMAVSQASTTGFA